MCRLIEQPRILDGDHCLNGKIFDHSDLVYGEWPHLLADQGNYADESASLQQWNAQNRSRLAEINAGDEKGNALLVGLRGLEIERVNVGAVLAISSQYVSDRHGLGARYS